MFGFAVISISSRSSDLSMLVAMIGVPDSSASFASLTASCIAAPVFFSRASFSNRGSALSTVCRSARIISVWIVEMSSAGDTLPSTCVTSSSRNTRVTWQIASDSRMCDRNLLPRPSPSDAPFTMPATVQFVDIAGIVKGASEGEGLGNKFLSHIRESDAICQVTRVFRDEDVTHVDGKVSPADDISTIQTEMILADLQTVDKALPRLEKEARLKKTGAAMQDAVKEAKEALESGTPIIATNIDKSLLRELMLMTAKPNIYVFNCDSDELADEPLKQKMRDIVAPSEAIFLDAKFEAELVELDDDDEARSMLSEMGIEEPGLDVLARVGFDTLGLQTYLTAGPKESRAWTIPKGATAPEAAGVIHTDFQRGFIKAEVVSFDDLVAAGSMAAAKSVGKVRMEGKDYVMADGDVVEFRFNV